MTSADKFGIIITIAICIVAVAFVSAPADVSDVATQPTTSYESSPPPSSSSSMVVPKQEPVQQSMSDDNLTNVLKYNIRGGIVNSITGDEYENSVIIDITSRLPGELSITLQYPNSATVITPFDGTDYFVTVDGEENHDYIQAGHRLNISFEAGTEQITIFGDNDYSHGQHDSDKAAADKAAADKAAADKAAADKAAAAIPKTAEVKNAEGSSAPGCEPNCFMPSTVTIAKGGTVTFSNPDSAPHTTTSGDATGGPDGTWDSSLVMPGASYDVTLNSSGTYNYFCMVHPWMAGTVIVK